MILPHITLSFLSVSARVKLSKWLLLAERVNVLFTNTSLPIPPLSDERLSVSIFSVDILSVESDPDTIPSTLLFWKMHEYIHDPSTILLAL